MNKARRYICNRFVVPLLIAFGLAIIIAFWLPLLASTGKGVGNIGTRMTCQKFLRLAKTVATTNEHRFEISKAQPDLTHGFFCLPHDAQFIIRTNFLVAKSSQEIVIACTNSYRNVPGPGVWAALVRGPRHAVGSADGKVKLISIQEFKALDLTGFVSLNELQAREPQPPPK